MYGVPEDLDLSRFHGAQLNAIQLGEFQLIFAFQPEASLSVEAKWELLGPDDCIIDQSIPNETRESYRIHSILGKTVTGSEVSPPHSITIIFENGLKLRCYDDSKEFESFSIHPGDIVA